MTIHRSEITTIPQSGYGRKFADEFEKRLKEQNAFKGRKETTQVIMISSEYWLELKE